MLVFKKIKHANKAILHANKKVKYKELEKINVPNTHDKEADKDKETLSAYDIKREENTSSTSEIK